VLRRRRWNYDLGGVLVRVVADSFMANLGLLFGFLVTFLYTGLLPTQNLTGLRSMEGKERTLSEYEALFREAGFAEVFGCGNTTPLDAVLALKAA
jgi:hypothetical protein